MFGIYEMLGPIPEELFSKYCTFSITTGICSMLVGRAENLLYNLQASTYTENEDHFNSAHNHIAFIKEDKTLKSLLLITFRGKTEKCGFYFYLFFEITSKNIQTRKSFLRMILETKQHIIFLSQVVKAEDNIHHAPCTTTQAN